MQYKASKEGTVVGVAVSKVAMLTHCQALTQACNYCEGKCHSQQFDEERLPQYGAMNVKSLLSFFCLQGETLVNVLDFKKDMGLWHGVLTVSELTVDSCRGCVCQ